MSCHPGTPCYGTTTVVDPCVSANGSSSNCCDTILYCGPALPNTGIDNNENLCLALQKIDAEFSNIQVNITANNGLTKTGDNIQLGGPLTKQTVITTNNFPLSIIGLPDDPNPDYILVVSSTGVIRRYLASSLGQTITLQNNVGLVWTNSPTNTNLSTLYNTLVPDVVTSVQVGGAAPDTAANWKQLTLVEVLNKILFPLQLPTYVEPVVTMTVSAPSPVATYYEVGSPLTFTAAGVGNKWDAGAFTAFNMIKTVNSGSPTSTALTGITPTTGIAFGTEFGFADPNSPNVVYTTSNFTDNLTIPAPTGGNTSSTVTYQTSGTHNLGASKKRSDNTNDTRAAGTGTNNPQAPGTKFSAITTITGIYPFFWGLSLTPPTTGTIAAAIAAGTANKILLPAGGTITVPFNNAPTAQYLWVAHAAAYTTKTKWFVTEVNKGDIGGPTNTFGSVQTINVTSPSPVYWSGISYKMYISNFTTIVPGNMELRNS